MNKGNQAAAAGRETAESMAARQRDISVSEFFLKNRHLLGFDSPRKALLTAVKEAVDNSLDACEEAGILPEIRVEVTQSAATRFCVSVLDNGPGIVKNQIPKIFGKLLYGSKFHRLRMARGQQGIGISAAGMYGQLTTGSATRVYSRIRGRDLAHRMEIQLDTRTNKPTVIKDEEVDWRPTFPLPPDAPPGAQSAVSAHGTCVEIEMEAAYVRGRLSVDEYLKQCAIVNPHLQLHCRVTLMPAARDTPAAGAAPAPETPWTTFQRAVTQVPPPAREIKPHPHGVELGVLMQMLKDTPARTVRSALAQDFSRVSTKTAQEMCQRAGVDPAARPARVAHTEAEALFKAIQDTKLMRPPTDCLAPIGEEQMVAGLQKEIAADFYTSVTRSPTVYRGNPFQVEVALAYAKPGVNAELGAEEPIRLMRIANRVPLLYMGGACIMTRAVIGVNWKAYGLAQPKNALPVGPMVLAMHMASVWVPFTSESKEAVAHYPEIEREFTFALQECGRRLSVYLSRKHRQAEADRKRSYIELYIPHLALGLRDILKLSEPQEQTVKKQLEDMLERTHLQT